MVSSSLSTSLGLDVRADWYNASAATAIQHICMAKALLLEHEVHKAHAGNAPEHIVRKIKVCRQQVA
jgi:hypothetical protein